MKILCVTSLYNRPEVSEVFIAGMRRLGIGIFVSVSEPRSRDLCKRLDVPYIEENNFPVGRKLNNTLRAALKLDWTHLMISGDDDVYTESILEVYEQHKYQPSIGFKSLYFVHPSSQRSIKFSYTDRPVTVGAGRLLCRWAVETVLRTCDGLWEGKRNRSLDASMDQRLEVIGMTPKIIELPIPCVIDIKSNQNIWSFDSLAQFTKNGTTIEEACYEDVISLISKEERELITRIPII